MMHRISSGLYILYIFVYSGGIFFSFFFFFFSFFFSYVPISLHCYSPHIPVSFAIILAHCCFFWIDTRYWKKL